MRFKDKVYEIVKQVPLGRVVTYGQVAAMAGKPKAARAVGHYMKTNPYAPIVPCHRVIASDGTLHGYSGKGGVTRKKELLISEGIIIKNNKIDLKKFSLNSRD